jgi:glucose dehydrogenase
MRQGKRIAALGRIGTSSLYILDRVTGKPIYGVEERPVPPERGDGREDRANPALPLNSRNTSR